jgi:hypothetical protein
LAEVATTEKKVPPIPTARAGTKLANRRAVHSWMATIRMAARKTLPHQVTGVEGEVERPGGREVRLHRHRG